MDQDRPMSGLFFRVMLGIMTLRGLFRNKRGEVLTAGVGPGDVVLDFGCGPGFNVLPAAEIVGEQGLVIALDIHQRALEIVRRKVAARGLANVQTVLSARDTGLEDHSVDRCLLYNALPMIADRAGVIREIHRVLRPGGTLALKSGRGSKLVSRGPLSEDETTRLLRDNGPLVLRSSTGKVRIFGKPG